MRLSRAATKIRAEESCGNAGAVESVESQRQASPSFHEPLGNLAQRRRDSHISTAPTTKADGKVENQKQVSPLSHRHDFSCPKGETPGPRAGFALRPAACAPRRLRVKR